MVIMVIIVMSAHTDSEKIGLKHDYFIFGAQRLWKDLRWGPRPSLNNLCVFQNGFWSVLFIFLIDNKNTAFW